VVIANPQKARPYSGLGSRQLEGLSPVIAGSTAKVEDGGVLVAVQDSEPALEAAMLERVFETFYTTKPTGFGLGLSICRSIIEAHGGRLWATRCEPRGALFQFTVPAD
jgi:signal transduction histidine kinase